jgi:site-specific recombinase XerD
MTPIETDISEYLEWMQIHNYARTTIAGRERYLGYMTCFLAKRGIVTCEEVSLKNCWSTSMHFSPTASVTGSP